MDKGLRRRKEALVRREGEASMIPVAWSPALKWKDVSCAERNGLGNGGWRGMS